MFFSYYGLREQPFGVTPDPRFLYETAVHREALASLLYGIESGIGFTALLAPPGMGKTTLLYHLLERYRHAAQSAFIFETQCNSHELLQSLCSDLALDTSGTEAELRARFKEHLAKQALAGRRVLVLIDEAQNLNLDVLETVRLLSNFETPREKLLHIILSGQPQLEANLVKPEVLQLRQRITLFTRLAPFAPEDAAAYIQHRLKIAGYRGSPLFTPNALSIIATESHGVPREINRICFNALSLGFALHKRVIDAEVLYEVINDLRLSSEPMPPLAWHEPPARSKEEEAPARSAESSPSVAVPKGFAAAPVQYALNDPFAPVVRPLPTAPVPGPVSAVAAKLAAAAATAPEDARTPSAPSHGRPQRGAQPRHVANTRPGLARTETSVATALLGDGPRQQPSIQEQNAEEASAAATENPEAAVQRALLDVALKSHHKSSYVPLAGVALIIPLLLWIIAYLIFRFDVVSLLRH